jgi:sulfotransferase family protein
VSERHPNFFIVGAARAGTTSLWHCLRQHPDVFMPKTKEPHFFSDNRPPWALSDYDAYLGLFRDADRARAIGEASSGYLGDVAVPERIHQRYPDARIIIALRHPVDRAHSLYRLNCSLGVEWMPTFERALRVEDGRASSERFRRENPYFAAAYQYRGSGFIADHIERYQRLFPRSRIHYLLFDDLKRDVLGVLRDVFLFLGVDRGIRIDPEVQNESVFPYSVRLQHYLRSLWKRRVGGELKTPTTVGQKWIVAGWYTNLLFGRLFGRQTLDASLRRRLSEEYRNDIQRTMALTGKDLKGWLQD